MKDLLFSVDCWIFLLLNKTISNPLFDIVIPFATDGKHWMIPILIAILLFIYKERKKGLVVLTIALVTLSISDPLCVRILKTTVHRLRPCDPSYFANGHHLFLHGAHFLSGLRSSLSFPSAHAMNTFAQAMVFFLFYPKSGYYLFPLACFIGFTRIYIGVHYPSDILGGAIVGIVVGLCVYKGSCIVKRYISKKVKTTKEYS